MASCDVASDSCQALIPGMMSTAEWMTAVKADAPDGTAAGDEPGTLTGRKMLAAAAADMSHVNHNDPNTIHLNSMSNTEKDYHHELHRQHLQHQAMIQACYDSVGHVDQDCINDAGDAFTADHAPVKSGLPGQL